MVKITWEFLNKLFFRKFKIVNIQYSKSSLLFWFLRAYFLKMSEKMYRSLWCKLYRDSTTI